MDLRKKVLIYILAILLVYSVYFWGIPAIVNIEHRVDLIKSTVKKNLGYNINLENPKLKMGLSPSILLYADGFDVLNDDNTSALEIKKPVIKISLLPFIIGKCHIKYFSANSIKAHLSLDKDSNLYLGQYVLEKSSKSMLDLNKFEINIQDYKIEMLDKSLNKNIYLQGDYFTVNEYIKNKSIIMSTSAVLKVDNDKSTINLDLNIKLPWAKNLSDNDSIFSGTITNLNLSNLSKYITYFTDNRFRDVKGILNLEARTDKVSNKHNKYNLNFTFEKFGINGKGFVQPFSYNNRIEFTSDISAVNRDLVIEKILLNAKDLKVLLSGKILKITSNAPALDIVSEIINSRCEGIVNLLPANNKYFEEAGFDIETLVKTGFFGDINSKLNIKGTIREPKTTGLLLITNAYVTPFPLTNGADKATVTLEFIEDKLEMDVFVPASRTQWVRVKGYSKLFEDKASDLHITSSQNVDIALVQKILIPIHKVLKFELGPMPVMDLHGIGSIDLKVYGNKINAVLNGIFNFSNATLSFNDINNMVVKNAYGSLIFKDRNTIFKTKSGLLNGKPISINGTCTLNGDLDYNAVASRQQVRDLLLILQESPMLKDIAPSILPIEQITGYSDLKLNIYGKVKDIDDVKFAKTINAKGEIDLFDISTTIEKLNIPITNVSGKISFDNLNIKIKLESLIHKSKLITQGTISNGLADLKISSENMTPEDLLLYFGSSKFAIPKSDKNHQRRGFVTFLATYKGSISKIDYKKLLINAAATFNDFKFSYIPKKIPMEIVSGNIIIKNNTIGFNNLNTRIAEMPVFIRGKANNIYEKPDFNIYLNSKPNQTFADIGFNHSAIYPIKLKGDITNLINLRGTLENFDIKGNIKLAESAKIYYMGSTIGDETKPTEIHLDANFKKDNVFIKSLTLDRMISSQNNHYTSSRELMISGGLNYTKDNIFFNDFKIKTLTPTDTKIFNIIFKKPFIKQGIFNSDIKINGSLLYPKILGTLRISDIDIPNYFINVKNIDFDFNNKDIQAQANGKIFEKDFKLSSVMRNQLRAPYYIEDLNLSVTDINIDEISANLKTMDIDSTKKLSSTDQAPVDLSSFIIKNSVFQTDTIVINNIMLHDMIAKLTIDENKVLSLNGFQFKTAQGRVNGDYSLDMKNNNHNASFKLTDINAGLFSETLFNLRNQISGNIIGNLDLKCSGSTREACISTLSGHGGFNVKNGKMPKLGSLEYLLNAANLVKSGITGFSINSLVDLITPLRTGEFESIIGTYRIDDGICNDIQIFSTGKSLNLFIMGEYNLTTMIATMSVFGRLSKNAANILGPIGNTSLNALFNTIPGLTLSQAQNNYLVDNINKIPGIELNNKQYRIFAVDINGDINGDKYVKSFKWVE